MFELLKYNYHRGGFLIFISRVYKKFNKSLFYNSVKQRGQGLIFSVILSPQ